MLNPDAKPSIPSIRLIAYYKHYEQHRERHSKPRTKPSESEQAMEIIKPYSRRYNKQRTQYLDYKFDTISQSHQIIHNSFKIQQNQTA